MKAEIFMNQEFFYSKIIYLLKCFKDKVIFNALVLKNNLQCISIEKPVAMYFYNDMIYYTLL